jgi:hypothetical protein
LFRLTVPRIACANKINKILNLLAFKIPVSAVQVIIDGVRFLGSILWTDFALFGEADRFFAVHSRPAAHFTAGVSGSRVQSGHKQIESERRRGASGVANNARTLQQPRQQPQPDAAAKQQPRGKYETDAVGQS